MYRPSKIRVLIFLPQLSQTSTDIQREDQAARDKLLSEVRSPSAVDLCDTTDLTNYPPTYLPPFLLPLSVQLKKIITALDEESDAIGEGLIRGTVDLATFKRDYHDKRSRFYTLTCRLELATAASPSTGNHGV